MSPIEFPRGEAPSGKTGPGLVNTSVPPPFHDSLLDYVEQSTRSGSWALDAATGQLTVSPQLSAFLAWPAGFAPPQTDDGVLAAALAFYAPASRPRMARLLTACLDTSTPFDTQVLLVTGQSKVVPVRARGRAVHDGSGAVSRVQGMLQMVDASPPPSGRRAFSDNLQAADDFPAGTDPAFQQMVLVQACVDKLGDMIVITQSSPSNAPGAPGQRIVFVNSAFERRTGYSLADVQGQSPRLLQGKRSQPHELARIRTALQEGKAVRSELINYTKAGVPYWVEVEITPVHGEGRGAPHWVAVARDIHDRKAAEDEIEGLAFYDALTELPNRKMLMVRLQRALATSQERPASSESDTDTYTDTDAEEPHLDGKAPASEKFSTFHNTPAFDDTLHLPATAWPVASRTGRIGPPGRTHRAWPTPPPGRPPRAAPRSCWSWSR